jgi:hypothetical protein
MFGNRSTDSSRCSRAPRRVFAPQVAALEGRVLLSTLHRHHHAVHHRVHHHVNTVAEIAASAAPAPASLTPLAPGQFGPNTPYPFAGIRPGGFVLKSVPATAAPAAPAVDPPATTSTAAVTPLAPGQFGPNTPYPFGGIRPGGYVLR